MFRHRYVEIFEMILGRAGPKPEGFSESVVRSAEQRIEAELPPALRDYYLSAGRSRDINEAHNRLRPPDEVLVANDVLVFFDENQGVCCWGLRTADLGLADPVVYQGSPVEDPEWYSEALSCSDFLVLMLFLNACWGAYPQVGSQSGAVEVEKTLPDHWQRVVDHNGLRIYWSDGSLLSFLEGDDTFTGSARDHARFAVLEREFHVV